MITTTEMTNTPLSGVGGGGIAYIDRKVDKVSFEVTHWFSQN